MLRKYALMKKTILANLNDIPKLAKIIASDIKGGEIFALMGDLGSGKTTLVQAVGKELKIKHRITSPTFTILHCLPTKLKKSKKEILFYHLDLYRIKNYNEAKSLGLTDFWSKPHTVTFIEWADRIARHLPEKTTVIKLQNL